ncbi:MAG: exodeoxyribonuclease VII large subunit [SAR324 cluster bacterium]|nr:exodeoxyribonuclease VII large subunit [SAR324 cluster bacterium]
MSRGPLTVSQLTRRIKALLEENLGRVLVQGEISSLARPASGHIYFTLKDQDSQIKAALFKGNAAKIPFDLDNGQELLAQGRVSVYGPRGEYQLIVESLQPVGVGALQLAFEQLKEKLKKRGWFEERHKKELPFLPSGIGVVTSPTGAVIKDILHVLDRRFDSIPVLIAPCMVQGEAAAQAIAKQIKKLDQNPDIDVIIVGRGGGSLEDLWAFNEELVAEAIFQAETPIISAVGHETDFTLADFVSDLRAPTPTAAAELIAPIKEELLASLSQTEGRLNLAFANNFSALVQRLKSLQKRLKSPDWLIQTRVQRIDELSLRLSQGVEKKIKELENQLHILHLDLKHQAPNFKLERLEIKRKALYDRLGSAMNQNLREAEKSWAEASSLLNSLSPLAVLDRGYSLTQSKENNLIESLAQVKVGDELMVSLRDGKIKTKVTALQPNKE